MHNSLKKLNLLFHLITNIAFYTMKFGPYEYIFLL